jgi:hypothetical protein
MLYEINKQGEDFEGLNLEGRLDLLHLVKGELYQVEMALYRCLRDMALLQLVSWLA